MLQYCIQLMPTLLKEEAEITAKDLEKRNEYSSITIKNNFRYNC